jgi:hypothetical protein
MLVELLNAGSLLFNQKKAVHRKSDAPSFFVI